MSLLASSPEGHILTIEFRRPREGNALNRQLQRELAKTWKDFEETDELWIAILHAEGGVFSIGHDLEELGRSQADGSSAIPVPGLFPLRLSKPVIAAIEGACYGLGFELALTCDLRVAGQEAEVGFPNQNLCVGYRIASVLLPRMTSLGAALELLWSGEVVSAKRAEALRLVNQVVPSGESLGHAREAAKAMLHRFNSGGTFQKRRIWQLSGMTVPAAMAMVRGTSYPLVLS